MSTEKTLKHENLRYVRAYTTLIAVIFWWIIQGLSIEEIMDSLGNTNDWLGKLMSATVAATLAYIVTIILTGLLSPKTKYIFVFWRLRNTLPGHRAFSHLMRNDYRIDTEALVRKYGELPRDPVAQNKLWFKIYKKHEMDKTVLDAHKYFLLMRELTTIAIILILIFSLIGFWLVPDGRSLFYYILTLLILAMLTARAGRNYGERFVTNVLANA
ncbi:hypothetical protein C7B76_32365, partial [filamentous cyanobacterium CCP2]